MLNHMRDLLNDQPIEGDLIAVRLSAHERDRLSTVLHMGSNEACYNGNDEN